MSKGRRLRAEHLANVATHPASLDAVGMGGSHAGAKKFFFKINHEMKRNDDGLPPVLLLTHPSDEQRLAALEQVAQNLPTL